MTKPGIKQVEPYEHDSDRGERDTDRLTWLLSRFENGCTIFHGKWTRLDIDAAMREEKTL